MTDPIVTIENLGKVYEPFPKAMRLLLRTSVKDPVVALDDVSLQVFPGDMMAVLGPNGAGKSTLFRILTGLTTPSAGNATVLGYDATNEATAVRRLVGFMPAENRTLLLRHTCRENLAFHGRLQGISRRELDDRVDHTLDMVGLAKAKDRVGFALSSGMLARLMFARAILHEPSVLVLDEPTAAVDPLGSIELLSLIQDVAVSRGLAVLISSHRLDEVEMLDDKVVLLNEGKVLYSGDLGRMAARSDRPYIELEFDEDTEAEKGSVTLAEMQGVDDVHVEGTTVQVNTHLSIRQIMTGIDGRTDHLVSIGRAKQRLRDVLREMLERDER
jgi:ABC-2 type transport system ATP-binding protein